MKKRNFYGLTQARACELFIYDPETGALVRTGSRGAMHAGDLAGGDKTASGRKIVGIDKRSFEVTDVIWLIMTGEYPDGFAIEMNGVIGDHRWENLACVPTIQGTRRIRRKLPKSGFRGVYRSPNGQWWASIFSGTRRHHLGTFDRAEDAARAYDWATFVRRGEAGFRNFPNETPQPVAPLPRRQRPVRAKPPREPKRPKVARPPAAPEIDTPEVETTTPPKPKRASAIPTKPHTDFKGVLKSSEGFIAKIDVYGVTRELGRFDDAVSAARAYDEAARQFYGRFAETNF